VNAKEKVAAKTAVTEQARKEEIEFFRDPQDRAYATVPVMTAERAHRETWQVDSHRFWLWVAKTLTEHFKAAPPKSLVNEIVAEHEMRALCYGPEFGVSIRVAEHEGATYLDLVNDDWQAIEISERGWRIVNEPPVKFRRDAVMASLPVPIGGGDPKEILGFLSLRPQDEILVLTWMSYTLYRARGPYPTLVLIGTEDSGKSTISSVLAGLIDPSKTELTDLPHDKRSLVIYASNRRLLPFDNLSKISPKMADALCRIARGGAARERMYHTNNGREEFFIYQNSMILNGIGELLERPDLSSTSMAIHTQSIAEDRRIPPDDFKPAFEAVRPNLLGAMLDVVVAGIRGLPSVHLPWLPRMADFYRWGHATEIFLGYEPGAFAAAYRSYLADMNASALEASPVGWVVYPFLMEQVDRTFRGTSLGLLQALTEYAEMREGLKGSQALARKHPQWPRSASAMSVEIRRIERNFTKVGIEVKRWRSKAARYVELRMTTTVTEGSDEPVNTQTTEGQEVTAQVTR
jgi:energy-coupling factor transporter ATP-binding protein EcfA2